MSIYTKIETKIMFDKKFLIFLGVSLLIGLIPFTGTFIENAKAVGLALIAIPGGFLLGFIPFQAQLENKYCGRYSLLNFIDIAGIFFGIGFYGSLLIHVLSLIFGGNCAPGTYGLWGALYGLHFVKKKALALPDPSEVSSTENE